MVSLSNNQLELLPSDNNSIRIVLILTLIAGGIMFRVFNPPQPVQPECDPNAIHISLIYSSEVDYYLPEIMQDFNARSAAGTVNPNSNAQLAVSGRPICVTGKAVSAGTARTGIVNAISAPNDQNAQPPTVWIPSVSTWLLLANQDAKRSIFDLSEAKATALAPVVIAIWQRRLDAIRQKVGYHDIGWEELLAVLTSPNGWCDYGLNPCRPAVYYGHTNPFNSPTGLSTLISEFYASARANGFTDPTLNLAAVNRPDIQLGVQEIEGLIRHYSDRTTEFINYIAQGPDYVDFVALEENDVIAINQEHRPNGQLLTKPPEALVALYPKEGTFIHDHPFGIVHADWVTPEEHDAAKVFRDYLLTTQEQNIIMTKGFRPAVAGIPIASPIDKDHGVDPASPKTLPIPDVNTLLAIQQSWFVVKKKADILLLIDVSGSMTEEDKLTKAKQALRTFLDKVETKNRVGLMSFSTDVHLNFPMSDLETSKDQIHAALDALHPEGGTELNSAVQQAIRLMNQNEQKDHIRVVVLLSDGQDTGTHGTTLEAALQAIKDTVTSLNPVIVIPVAYGSDADFNALNALARTSKTGLQFGDSENILNVLTIIASLG